MKFVYTSALALFFANLLSAQQTSNTNPAAKPSVAPVQNVAPAKPQPAVNEATALPVFENAAQKQQWINEHPAEYRRLSNLPSRSNGNVELPNDFPQYEDTGNGQADAERYNAAKAAWIAKNPERYQALQGQNPGPALISKQEFDAMPAEKQQNILAHPELYKVQE